MPDRPSRALVAEAIGTFALCFVGILAITHGTPDVQGSLVGIAFAHGLTIAVMVAALGAISGGHFNPAVTFGFMVTGRMTPARGAGYVASQLAGALAASALVAAVFGTAPVATGTPVPADTIGFGQAVTIEAVTTFFLVLVIFGTAVDERAPAGAFPLAIGLTVTLDILGTGPMTGAAMNPARVLGPALVSGEWTGHAIYWAGPLLGGALAALLSHGFFLDRAPTPAVAERGGPAPAEDRVGG